MAGFLEERGRVLVLRVKVVPNSSRTQLAGMLGDALKVKVAQPPEDGKANAAVVELLQQILGARVTLLAGQTRPQKTLQISGLARGEAERRIAAAMGKT